MVCATAIGAGRLRERMFPANLHQLKDRLTTELQDRSAKHWKKLLSNLSLAERRAALRLPEAISDLGAKRIAAMEAGINEQHELIIDRVPSAPWLDRAYHDGAEFPVPGMVLGQAKVRFHIAGSFDVKGKSRFTPPNNVEQEDALDSMSIEEAEFFTAESGYASPSAIAIRKCRMYRVQLNTAGEPF